MGILFWLIIGALAGWLAGKIMRGGGFGILGNLVVGIVGALIGGALFRMMGLPPVSMLGSLISATVGACVLGAWEEAAFLVSLNIMEGARIIGYRPVEGGAFELLVHGGGGCTGQRAHEWLLRVEPSGSRATLAHRDLAGEVPACGDR